MTQSASPATKTSQPEDEQPDQLDDVTRQFMANVSLPEMPHALRGKCFALIHEMGDLIINEDKVLKKAQDEAAAAVSRVARLIMAREKRVDDLQQLIEYVRVVIPGCQLSDAKDMTMNSNSQNNNSGDDIPF